MTTLTGATDMKSLPDGPPFAAAMFGATLQLGTLAYVWSDQSSAHDCLTAPLGCLARPWAADAWGRTAVFTVSFALFMWALSLRTLPQTGTSDPSIVDRLWSVMPWLYMWHWVFSSPVFSPRLLIMTLLATLWGFRLTYNFWIKGGFSGGEDYRWVVVRKWYPGWQWEVFNLFFVCLFQQCTVLAFSVPAVAAMQSDAPLGFLDCVATALYLLLLAGETLADRQMYEYQTEKYRRKNVGEDPGPYARGFIETGLWAYSRHPNYFCEVSMWWAFYLFSIPATGKVFNWTIWGAIFLAGLFLPPGASLDVTEALSSAKYPAYADYQSRVSRYAPWFPRARKAD